MIWREEKVPAHNYIRPPRITIDKTICQNIKQKRVKSIYVTLV